MKSKGWLITVASVALVVALAGACIVLSPALDDAIVTHFVEQKLRAGNKALLGGNDALKVLLCGTSAPFADPNRAQSCTAIIAGGRYFLVDTGPGSGRNLELWNLRGKELDAVFLTHFHSDHIGDLGEVNTNAWLAGHPGALPVFGGPGVERVVRGFNEAYGFDQVYRTANSGPAMLPPAADRMEPQLVALIGPATLAKDRRSLPLHFGDMTVTAIEVDHDPAEPAYGYRFDYKGRSVVVSGDTNYHPSLAVAAKETDVLVHETQSQHLVQVIAKAAANVGDHRIAATMAGIEHYHTDPLDAARTANEADAKLLVLTHLNPPPSNLLVRLVFYRGMNRARKGRWMSGQDGTLITLPVGSSDLLAERLTR